MEHSMELVVLVVILVAQWFFITPGETLGTAGSSVDVVERSRAREEVSIRELQLQPIVETEYRVVELAADADRARRRRLAPFQLCLPCKCCAANTTNSTYCATMPCCFGIDCQLPNKPFGVCAFVPKTCNCTSCAAT